LWGYFADNDEKVKEDKANDLFRCIWQHDDDLGDWAKKYWRAVNAINTEYVGISVIDMVIANKHFDKLALEKALKVINKN